MIDFWTVRNGRYILVFSDINDAEMNKLHSNVQIILKKINKKDPITKYKVTNKYFFCSVIEIKWRLN